MKSFEYKRVNGGRGRLRRVKTGGGRSMGLVRSTNDTSPGPRLFLLYD